MDLRSGRRLGSRPPQQRQGPSRRRGADRISFLSDDMILLILERLRCIRTAVRTGVLSRRWRGLWTRLTDLAFSGVAPATIEAALSRFKAASPAGTTFQLDIRLPSTPETAEDEANSLLRAAALFSPAGIAFTITPYLGGPRYSPNVIKLPCFQHATSIELHTQQCTVKLPVAGEFPALESLSSISGRILHIGDFVTRCPRLRVLRAKFRDLGPRWLEEELGSLKDALRSREVAVSIDIGCDICISKLGEFVSGCPSLRALRVDAATSGRHITVHSTTLQELVLGPYKDCRGINIVAPQLKQLTMEVHAGGVLETSVLAPLLKKVSWRRRHTWPVVVFGFWVLKSLSLETATSIGERVLAGDGEDDAWLSVQQLPGAHVLSMAMCASGPSFQQLDFAREMEILSVTEFSVVGIRLEAMGHAYGATLFHLLQALQVHSATRILKVNLVMRTEISEVTKAACTENCFCDDEPKDWSSQSIPLPHLEEVEIQGFKGENHGFDFLKLICRCAPKLTKGSSASMIAMLLHATRLF
uniref:Uncharacterized protein n=1 Tax=Avena sativa TaxID=4498 RepID=A0ACD5WDI7_AVESA